MSSEVITLENLSTFKGKCDETYQSKLTAGENITISEDNVISATVPDISDMETKTHAAATYQPKGDYALNGTSYTKSESDEKYAEKLDDIPVIAGANVSLEVDDAGKLVISATGGKIYEGIDPIIVNNVNNTISADTVTIEAANGISISNGTISLIYSTIEV